MGAGSPAGSDREEAMSPFGIVQGHAYSILDVQAVDEHQLIRLREWTNSRNCGLVEQERDSKMPFEAELTPARCPVCRQAVCCSSLASISFSQLKNLNSNLKIECE
jgi:hypothetical protein